MTPDLDEAGEKLSHIKSAISEYTEIYFSFFFLSLGADPRLVRFRLNLVANRSSFGNRPNALDKISASQRDWAGRDEYCHNCVIAGSGEISCGRLNLGV